jgi:hypothetical protein
MKINKIEKVNKTPREFPKKEEEDLNLKKLLKKEKRKTGISEEIEDKIDPSLQLLLERALEEEGQ